MLIDKLKQYIKTIDFEEGQPLVTVSFNSDWKIIPNNNFLIQTNGTLHLIASNKPNTQLDIILGYIQEIVDFNLEIVAKKEWVYKMSQQLKLMASELPLNELNCVQLINTRITNQKTEDIFDDAIGGYDDIIPNDIRPTYDTSMANNPNELYAEAPREIPYHILAEIERENNENKHQMHPTEWVMEREDYIEEK